MSRLLRWSAGVLGAVLVLGVCAKGYADLTAYTTLNPYNPGTTASYGTAAGDYQSRADSFGVPSNDLLGANVGQGGGTGGLGVTRIGLGELITPQTGSTYGAPNNHGLTVNTLTLPLAGGGAASVTLMISPGTFTNAGNPVAPNDGDAADVWTPGAAIYTNTFAWNPGANALLATFDLQAANTADPGNNPAPPALSLNNTYLVSLEWGMGTNFPTNTVNSVVWYRGLSVDPGGQIMIELNQGQGFKTFAAAPFGAGAPRAAALAINAPAVVPEPAGFALLVLAAPAVWAARRRKGG